MNYRGYFSSFDNKEYAVLFIADSNEEVFTEIELADDPVQIRYQAGDTLFAPTQISTCTVTVVNDEYLQDLFTPYAQGVEVQIYCSTDQRIVWQGYLKPQIYSQGYDKCWEKIDFECSDCLASLKYIDYQNYNGGKRIVTFKNIIDHACDLAGVDGYYWDNNKLLGSNNVLTPEKLTISEQNFYTEDTDEPWKYFDVVEEMCKYLGMTLIQWGTYFYFVDYQDFHTNTSMSTLLYEKRNNYAGEGERVLGAPVTITEDTYKGNGHTISFEPIYNKASVKANFYYAKDFLPDMWEDDYITNRYGGSTCVEIPPQVNQIQFRENKFTGNTAYTPVYLSKGYQKHDADDSVYVYYRRLLDHDYYSPVYHTSGLTPTTPPAADLTTVRITRDYISGQLVDFGYADRGNATDASYELASSISFDKYLLIHTWDKMPFYFTMNELRQHVNDYPPVYQLNSGYTNPIIVDEDNSYLCLFANALFQRYKERDYFNPDWTNEPSQINSSMLPIGIKGISYNIRPFLNFKLGIGNKWWNGSAWTTTETNFWVKCRTEEDEDDTRLMDPSNWNSERDILNNINFTEWTGADGYKIPLDNSIDMNSEVHFAINVPNKLGRLVPVNFDPETGTSGQNHWCWLKDLELTIHNKLTSEKKEDDIIYGAEEDGIIDANSVMELSDVEMKFTTFPGDAQLSYSNVGLATGGFLSGVVEPCLIVSHVLQKPEENVLTKIINQYSSQTIKERLTVDINISPFQKIYDAYWGNGKHFVWNGTEIDLKRARQTITIVETK